MAELIVLKYNPNGGPGTWRYWHAGTLAEYRRHHKVKPRVRVVCPQCSNCYLLNHEVADDGTVTPSLDCPTEKCEWHVMGKLEDWKVKDAKA